MARKAESETLERRQTTALARPDFIKAGDTRGTENITQQDIRPPALRLAQSMSPQVKRNDPAYIKDLHEGEMFNSLTGENFGEEAIQIVVINQLGHRHVEFAPLDEGGGVIDFNVPDSDPRTEFTTVVKDGAPSRARPVATKFYDYLILALIGEREELMTLSMKSTQLKVATKLNTLLAISKVPSFGLRFSLAPVADKRGVYNFYNWRLDPAGWVTEELYARCSDLYDKLNSVNVHVETEVTQVEDTVKF